MVVICCDWRTSKIWTNESGVLLGDKIEPGIYMVKRHGWKTKPEVAPSEL